MFEYLPADQSLCESSDQIQVTYYRAPLGPGRSGKSIYADPQDLTAGKCYSLRGGQRAHAMYVFAVLERSGQ